MRIMFDTNVLISMVLFPSASFREMLDYVIKNHRLVLSSFVVEELLAVVDKKFPDRRKAMDEFLTNLTYELVYTPHHMSRVLFEIRDKNDYPVLYTAIIENVDIFITGDKDFLSVNVDMPEIMTPAEFVKKYQRPE